MTTPQKITEKEWDNFVDPQLHSEGMTTDERNAIRAAFFPSLKDVDSEERKPFMGQPVPGITKKELDETMAVLRDPHSPVSRDSKARLHQHPERLDRVEKVLKQALEGNKESRWF